MGSSLAARAPTSTITILILDPYAARVLRVPRNGWDLDARVMMNRVVKMRRVLTKKVGNAHESTDGWTRRGVPKNSVQVRVTKIQQK